MRSEVCNYKLEDLVHPPEDIEKHLIDYRVKLLLKQDIRLAPGYEVLCETACIIKDGMPDFCLHIKKMKRYH